MPTPTDYKAANAKFKQQKAALTRAVNSKDPKKIEATVRKHVKEWSQAPFNGAWPDDWHRWQRALNDSLPWHSPLDIEDVLMDPQACYDEWRRVADDDPRSLELATAYNEWRAKGGFPARDDVIDRDVDRLTVSTCSFI